MTQNCCNPLPDFELWYSLDYVNSHVDAHHRNYSVGDLDIVGEAHVIDTHSAAYITSGLLWVYAAPFVLVVGTIGSVLSLLVLCRKSMRNQTTMFYLAVLAVTDLMVLYTGLVRLWLEHANNIYIRLHSDTACKLHTFVVYISLDCSAWILVAVSVDRCLYVTWPHRAKIWCTMRNARITVTAIAGTVCLVNMHFFWTYQLEGDDHDRIYSNGGKKCYAVTSSSFTVRFVENVWPWIDLCVYCLFPFLFMVISNAIIIKQLVRSERTMKSHAKRLFFRRSRSKSELKPQRQISVQSNDIILTSSKDEPISEKCANMNTVWGIPIDLRTVSNVSQQRPDVLQKIRLIKDGMEGGAALLMVKQETSFDPSKKKTFSRDETVLHVIHPKSSHDSAEFPSHKSSCHDVIPASPVTTGDFINSCQCFNLLHFEARNNVNNETKTALGMSIQRAIDISKSEAKSDQGSHRCGEFHNASFRGSHTSLDIPDYIILPDHKQAVSPSSVSASFAFGGEEEDILFGSEPQVGKSKVCSLIKPRTSHYCKVHPLLGTTDNTNKSKQVTSVETLRPGLLHDGNVCNDTCMEKKIHYVSDGGGIPIGACSQRRGEIRDSDIFVPTEISDSKASGTDDSVNESKEFDVYQNVGSSSDATCARGETEATPPRGSLTCKRRTASAGSEPQPSTSSRRNTSNVSITLLVVTITFWVLNSPIVIFIVGYTYWAQGADDQMHAQLFLAWAVVNILQYVNNAVHLFLYCLTGPKFRQELMTMLKSLGVGVQQLKTRVCRGGSIKK